ncbi:arginine-tRNA ligase [Trichophyton interdigitale H6]|nr:arginine-tRNA ligase [Trichophyton interdigitale H6]
MTENVIRSILANKDAYGSNPNVGLRDQRDASKGKKKVVVEFSSPNIAKPFHAGHLRSTIIGGFIANLYTILGWEVLKINYLGDWGKQYGLLASGYEKYGSEEELLKDPINHLFEVYVKINQDVGAQEGPIKELKEQIKAKKEKHEDVTELEKQLEPLVDASYDEKARRYFKSMEDGDEKALELWRRFRDLSIEKYKQTYARLNIDFDVYSGESQVKDESIKNSYKAMENAGVSESSEGAVIIDFAKHGAKKLGKAIVIRKDGTPLYLTRDIAAIVERDDEYQFDKMIYVVAAQQELHLAQLFKTTELVGKKDLANRCEHISFGMVRGMSTRKGTVKFLNDILKDVGEKMHEVMQKNQAKYEQIEDPVATADILGITSVMVQDMSGKRYVRHLVPHVEYTWASSDSFIFYTLFFSFFFLPSSLPSKRIQPKRQTKVTWGKLTCIARNRINGYEFNLENMTSFEGDTGPYLQYAHARVCSVTRKAEIKPEELGSADLSLLTESHAVDLVRLLAQWPDVVFNASKTLEPCTILTYLFRMTHMLSSGYDVLKVVGSEPEVKMARMALYESARQVLHNGMRLLGLNPVKRM